MYARIAIVSACALSFVLFHAPAAAAQDAPKPIGPFVVDIRGTMPRFPSSLGLANSRGINQNELPGTGLGLDLAAHVYPLKWKAVTFGAGAQVALGRSRGAQQQQDGVVVVRAVTEQFTSVSPQISFNFGSGSGWSYLSAGVGPAVWSIVPNGLLALPADSERLTSYNYGGGARWFARPHLAFTFDVRFYDIYPGTSSVIGFPGSPRTKMLILGAGVSVK